MNIEVIADIGSCHNNRLEYFEHAIDVCERLGVTLKAQLFGPETALKGNVELDHQIFADAADYAAGRGVPFFASVWREQDLQRVLESGITRVKVAYSRRADTDLQRALRSAAVHDGPLELIVSEDHSSNYPFHPAFTPLRRLFCVPQYPVYAELSFDRLFPEFQGFSDHTLGIRQTVRAISAGASIIEKHVAFDGAADCLDKRFAIDEHDLETLMSSLKGYNGGT